MVRRIATFIGASPSDALETSSYVMPARPGSASPLLFLLYVNDLPNSVPGENIQLFADDTNLFISASTIRELEQKANTYILNINKWLIANKLHLNIEKNLLLGLFTK